jgi:hypothetical protein
MSTAIVTAAFVVAWWVRPRVVRLGWLLPSVLLVMASVDHTMTNAVAFSLRGRAARRPRDVAAGVAGVGMGRLGERRRVPSAAGQ